MLPRAQGAGVGLGNSAGARGPQDDDARSLHAERGGAGPQSWLCQHGKTSLDACIHRKSAPITPAPTKSGFGGGGLKSARKSTGQARLTLRFLPGRPYNH